MSVRVGVVFGLYIVFGCGRVGERIRRTREYKETGMAARKLYIGFGIFFVEPEERVAEKWIFSSDDTVVSWEYLRNENSVYYALFYS